MIRVLFICHGNICRSPMAEYLFRDMVEKRGLSAQFHIASAATSREEIGNGVYPPAKRKLASVGISCTMHHARQVTKEDYAAYDYLLVAERYNIPNLMRQIKEDPDHGGLSGISEKRKQAIRKRDRTKTFYLFSFIPSHQTE